MGMIFAPMIIIMVICSGMDTVDVIDTGLYFKKQRVEYTEDALMLQLGGKAVKKETVDLSSEIETLQNGSPEQRKKAKQTIMNAGPSAKPWLEKLKDSDDPELKVTAENMLKQLKTPDVNKDIHRLLVIRALGDLKARKAVPALEKIAASDNAAEAYTAQKALADISGKSRPKRSALSPSEEMKWIPDKCALVLRNRIIPSKPLINLSEMIGMMGGMMGPRAGSGNPMEMINEQVIKLMADTGYFRIDDVMFAMADDVGDKSGFMFFLLKGIYDKKTVFSYLKNNFGLHAETISGVDVLSKEHFLMALIDKSKVMIFMGPDRKTIPAETFLANYKRHQEKKPVSGAVGSTDWGKKLLKDVDVTSDVWAICQLSNEYKAVPQLKPFDTGILKSDRTKEGHNILTLKATGKEKAAVKKVVDELSKNLDQAKKQMAGAAANMPYLKNIGEIINLLKISAEDSTATMTVNCKEYSPSGMWMGFMPYFFMAGAMRKHPMPPPQ